MADQNTIDTLGTLGNVYTGADLAWAALQDSMTGQPLGTTATTRFGVIGAGFGVAEQLAILDNSSKSYADFERFATGMATNIPGPIGVGLIPKKWFDDNFDRGPKEAEKLRDLLDIGKKLRGLLKPIDDFMKDTFDAGQKSVPRRDPLTLDLDGDGLETVGFDPSHPVYFDHDLNGTKEGTGWVAPDDGFLVLDRNGNGVIDNGAELFGDHTPLTAGGYAADGFAALVQEDTNSDGKVDSTDARFADLRVWRDLNQDGISQASELTTLTAANIAAINVAKTANSQTLANGNQIADLGAFTSTDGSSGALRNLHGAANDFSLRKAA